MALSLLMRIHLVWPNAKLPFTPGGQMTPEQYLALVTMHGSIMVFMVLTTAPQSGFGNYMLPIQIGAEDMAFPVLNMLSFWTTFVSLVVLLSAFFVTGGAPISGWTAYPTLSALGQITGPGQGLGQTLWVIGVAIFCVASLLGALNFITTTLDLRAKGMTLGRMPLTVWAWLITAILGLLAFGVLLAACILLLLDRMAGTSFFIPGGLVVTDTPITWHKGGSPLLWQHLFWFFGHPEVYIAILPGMGVASHVLSTFSRKPVFGYRAMVAAMSAIGFLGFCVWGHHMFVSGMSPYSAFAFSLMTMTIGVPSAIKTFNWLGTLWGGKIQFTTAMLFALGFRLAVRHRRPVRPLPGAAVARPLPARHLFRRRALPLDHGRGGDLRHLLGHLFLVPEDVRPDAERDHRQDPLLDHLRRRLLHLHAHALPGFGGPPAALRRYQRRQFPRAAALGPLLHHHRGDDHHHRAVSVPVQSVLQHVCRREGQRESLERHDAGMVDPVAAAVR